MNKRIITIISIIICILISSKVLFSQEILNSKPKLSNHKIIFNGQQREYILYMPDKKPSNNLYPLVFCFHGGMGNAKSQMRLSKMNEVADEQGFLAVYPEGTSSLLLKNSRTWNAGDCCGRAKRINSDDVGFTKAIIKDLKKNLPIDEKRIYATGMSNGAMMSYKLACDAPDVFAAIAPVAGTLNYQYCNPKNPVPIMHFHGTDDEHCRYYGGVGKSSVSKLNFNSVPYTINKWKSFNSCSNQQKITYKKGAVTCVTNSQCNVDSEVILCTIEKGGHTWPGGETRIIKRLGKVNEDISASHLMWQYFQKHSKK